MNYHLYTIVRKEEIQPETFVFWLKPEKNPIPPFLPGQYVYIKNPSYKNSEQGHAFSIASSPLDAPTLEFCIKIYGEWTKALSSLPIGENLWISDAQGTFVWEDTITNAVFLLGGIGISPVISILRFIRKTHQRPQLTILYGNRNPQTIAYNDELNDLKEMLPLSIIHIFSHLPDNHPWEGYRGFITKDIIQKEATLTKDQIWFVVGPPIFIEKMVAILNELEIPNEKIKTEKVSVSPTSQS